MFSSILSSVLFYAVLIGSIVYAKPVSNDLCKVDKILRQDSCYIRLFASPKCDSSILDLADTEESKSCNPVYIFWDYPINNLTVIIETQLIQKGQPYSIELQSKPLSPQISHVYQVSENGVVTELQPEGDIITARSNADYQVILTFQAPTEFIYYGVPIKYKIVKN